MSIELSIIVPIYNKENTIKYFLDSIKVQKYLEKIEFIFIDDGSIDNSMKVLKNELKDSKLNYVIYQQENLGVSSARNKGLMKAKGEFIGFLDADDSVTLNYTFEIFKNLEKNKRIEMLWFGYNVFNRENEYVILREEYKKRYKYDFNKDSKKVLKKYLSGKISMSICSSIYKKSIINKEKVFFNEKYKYGEDQEFVIKYLLKAKDILCIPKELFNYISTQNSAMRTITVRVRHVLQLKVVTC